MRVLVRCIYKAPVEPSCDIINMGAGIWQQFLHATFKGERIHIVCNLLNREHMKDYIREVAWVPLDGKLEGFQLPEG